MNFKGKGTGNFQPTGCESTPVGDALLMYSETLSCGRVVRR